MTVTSDGVAVPIKFSVRLVGSVPMSAGDRSTSASTEFVVRHLRRLCKHQQKNGDSVADLPPDVVCYWPTVSRFHQALSLSVCLSVCLYMYLTIYLFIYLSFYLSIFLSIFLCFFLSFFLFFFLSFFLSFSLCFSVSISIFLLLLIDGLFFRGHQGRHVLRLDSHGYP